MRQTIYVLCIFINHCQIIAGHVYFPQDDLTSAQKQKTLKNISSIQIKASKTHNTSFHSRSRLIAMYDYRRFAHPHMPAPDIENDISVPYTAHMLGSNMKAILPGQRINHRCVFA